MGRTTLKGFDKVEKEVIKANAEILKARIEEAFPIEIKERHLTNLTLEVSMVAYMKYKEGYISYKELNGKQKLLYIKQEGYQWTNRKDEDEQKVVVIFNECVAMLYDVEGRCIANTQAVTDWSGEDRVLIYAESY